MVCSIKNQISTSKVKGVFDVLGLTDTQQSSLYPKPSKHINFVILMMSAIMCQPTKKSK